MNGERTMIVVKLVSQNAGDETALIAINIAKNLYNDDKIHKSRIIVDLKAALDHRDSYGPTGSWNILFRHYHFRHFQK